MKKNFIRRTMKKMAAIGTGVAMVGATLTGALAADLADYPEPFVVDGVYDDSNVLVVGDNAAAADTLGMVDISSNLQFESKVAVTTAGSAVSVEGGKSEQIPLGIGLANTTFFDTTLQDDDIAHLWDGEITFQGTSYDTSEELTLGATDPTMATSLTSSEDDYESGVYLEVTSRDSINFNYKFDETINLSAATSNDALKIEFLGNSLQVTNIVSATSFTAYVGEEHYLPVDGVVTVEGKDVTLIDVSSTSAIVDVDGVNEIINTDSTETVNGLEITVDDVFSRDERAQSSANLIIGTQSAETYKDGDEFVGEDEDDPDWVWNIAGLTTQGTSQTFGIENDFIYNDLADEPPMVGECIGLPEDYVEICFDSLTVADTDYATYTFEVETSADISDAIPGNSSVPALYLHTTVDEGFEMLAYTESNLAAANKTTTKKAKEIYLFTPNAPNLHVNGSFINATTVGNVSQKWVGVFYKDTADSKWKEFGSVNLANASTEILRVNYGNTKDTNIVLKTGTQGATSGFSGSRVNLTLDIVGDSSTDLADTWDDLDMLWGLGTANGTFNKLGATSDTEEANELLWGVSDITLGTKDEDHRTRYGIIIKDPKSNGASDEVELSIPQDQVFANVVIKGSSTTVSGGSTTYVPSDVTPVTKLASEVGTAGNFNLVLVGGPCANDLVDDLFDVTCDGWPLESGQAMLRATDNGDKVAILVAGTSADDTRRAAKALADHADHDLSGTEVIVSGTSLSDVNIESA